MPEPAPVTHADRPMVPASAGPAYFHVSVHGRSLGKIDLPLCYGSWQLVQWRSVIALKLRDARRRHS